MGKNPEPQTYGEGPRPWLGIILGGFGAAAGGLVGATIGIFVAFAVAPRDLGPPLTWLLGVAVGGVLGAGFGCFLVLGIARMLRASVREHP
jgi:hypothetical protein